MITFVGKVLFRGKKWTDHKFSSPKKEQKNYSFFLSWYFMCQQMADPEGAQCAPLNDL